MSDEITVTFADIILQIWKFYKGLKFVIEDTLIIGTSSGNYAVNLKKKIKGKPNFFMEILNSWM